MPRNFKEELLFTAMMAGLMVIVMETYNIALNQGSNGILLEVIKGYPLALIVAAIFDLGLVGPIAKGIFFKLIFKPAWEKTPIKIALGISTLMVLGMVTCMSLFGMIITFGFSGLSLSLYLHTWLLNLCLALPLQLLIVGPICRKLLSGAQTMIDAK